MPETHPYGCFVPLHAKYLILGSFATKEAFNPLKKASDIWFYSNGGRNQFWPILEKIYRTKLQTTDQKKKLLTDVGFAITDIIYQCDRIKKSNLDIHLTNITYAQKDIARILKTNKIEKIFFTSRYVEIKFRSNFKAVITKYPHIELFTLPSPSPRYIQMNLDQKLKKYQELLPLPK